MVAESETTPTHGRKVARNGHGQPRSLATSEKGIKSGEDFARFMSHLISDIIARRVTPDISNAACNAGGKLLKVVEMQYKYGNPAERGGAILELASGVKEGA